MFSKLYFFTGESLNPPPPPEPIGINVSNALPKPPVRTVGQGKLISSGLLGSAAALVPAVTSRQIPGNWH